MEEPACLLTSAGFSLNLVKGGLWEDRGENRIRTLRSFISASRFNLGFRQVNSLPLKFIKKNSYCFI